jgi:hypothetical protein
MILIPDQAGERTGRGRNLTLPWALALQLPLIRFALPTRFTMYVALIAAIAASLYLATYAVGRRRLQRFAFATSHGSKQPQVCHLDWTSADKHALLWASRGRWVRLPPRPRLAGLQVVQAPIVAVMNLETRHEAPHFEEQPCSCPEG